METCFSLSYPVRCGKSEDDLPGFFDYEHSLSSHQCVLGELGVALFADAFAAVVPQLRLHVFYRAPKIKLELILDVKCSF
jgi:hypothetical protein